MKKLVHNPHPGEILRDEFLLPLGLSQNELATRIGVPANRISDLVRGRRDISADTDLRLCHAFGLSHGFWLRLQLNFDMMEVKRNSKEILKSIKPLTKVTPHAA